jgi:hypothetical protein
VQAFDAPQPGLEYKHRWAAFGIAEGANGAIALVEVRKPTGRPISTCRAGRWTATRTSTPPLSASSARRPAWSSRSGRG